MKRPTQRQFQVLQFIAAFYARNDQLPPIHAVCNHFGWNSPNSAMDHVRALEIKGFLERNEIGKYRFTAAARAYIARDSTLARWFPTNGIAEPTNGTVCAPMPV